MAFQWSALTRQAADLASVAAAVAIDVIDLADRGRAPGPAERRGAALLKQLAEEVEALTDTAGDADEGRRREGLGLLLRRALGASAGLEDALAALAVAGMPPGEPELAAVHRLRGSIAEATRCWARGMGAEPS